uniref:DUF4821 domain-containing protein n=1 Tax=Echinostoma caproni TaxID=27848 RepID=A0A183AC26_9TREM
LAPLFNSQTDLLRKTYGNFYIAELVEAQSDDLKCIVVECDNKAVGFISATTKVNLDALNEVYDLEHCRIRLGKDPESELYVFHRAGLLRDFKVRRTRHSDTQQIEHLIRNMEPIDQALIRQDLQAFVTHGRDRDGAIVASFVAVVTDRIVGLLIMRDEQHIEWIRAHYDIEEFIYFDQHARNEHATLYHCVVAADFHCRREVFLKEVLRLSNKTCFYFRILPPYASGTFFNKATLITCLSAFYPVRPRRQIIYPPKEVLGEKGPEDSLLESSNAAPAIFISTAKLLTEPRVLINARIIVVGASTTGLAVLETLAGCSYISFSNLVLLSEHGLPGDTLEQPDKDAEKFLTSDHSYPTEILNQLALRHCVHVIHGKLTAINRKFKRITIDRTRALSYDYLVLTTGLQYHTCCPNGADIQEMMKTSEAPFLSTRRFSVEYPNSSPPSNLFRINNIQDAQSALRWIQNEYLPSINLDELNVPEWKKRSGINGLSDSGLDGFKQPSSAVQHNLIIVYGYNLDAYTCVAALLHAGVPGKLIVLIHPPRLPEQVSKQSYLQVR